MGVIGDVVGSDLASVTRRVSADRVAGEAVAAGIAAAVAGRFPDPMDVEGATATMLGRGLPPRPPGGGAGPPPRAPGVPRPASLGCARGRGARARLARAHPRAR